MSAIRAIKFLLKKGVEMNKKIMLIAIVLVLLVLALVINVSMDTKDKTQNNTRINAPEPMVSVALPTGFSLQTQVGKGLFNDNCASCHGQNAAGQIQIAPPLIHKIYEPSHHGDESFQRAVAMGVQAHHWPFGNMMPVAQLNRKEVEKIIAYIRELQRENGIF